MKTIAPALILLLTACGQDPVERPTEAENAQHDEIDAMLDELGEGGDIVGNAQVNQAD